MKLFQRFTLLALIAGVLGSTLVMGCGGGEEETTTVNNAAGTTTTTTADD